MQSNELAYYYYRTGSVLLEISSSIDFKIKVVRFSFYCTKTLWVEGIHNNTISCHALKEKNKTKQKQKNTLISTAFKFHSGFGKPVKQKSTSPSSLILNKSRHLQNVIADEVASHQEPKDASLKKE